MCSVSTAATTATALLSAAISVQQIQTQKTVAKYQVQQMEAEAEHNKRLAEKEREEGIEEARNKRLQAILKMGDSTAKLAAGNLASSSVTLLNVNDQHKLNGELEALNTLNTTENNAENREFQAEKLYSNAALTSFNSKQQYKMGMMKVVSNTASSLSK